MLCGKSLYELQGLGSPADFFRVTAVVHLPAPMISIEEEKVLVTDAHGKATGAVLTKDLNLVSCFSAVDVSDSNGVDFAIKKVAIRAVTHDAAGHDDSSQDKPRVAEFMRNIRIAVRASC